MTSEQFSVVSGGVLAILGTLLIAKLYPELIGEDSLPPSGPGAIADGIDTGAASKTELAPDSLEDP